MHYPLMNRPDARYRLLSERLSKLDRKINEKYPDEFEEDFEDSVSDEEFFSDDLVKECSKLIRLAFLEHNLLYFNPDFHHWLLTHKLTLESVSKEFHRLKSYDQNHSLLRYFSEISSERFVYSQDKKIRKEFVRTYDCSVRSVNSLFSNYYVALRNVVDEIEGIDRTPKPYESIDFSDFDDKDFPF